MYKKILCGIPALESLADKDIIIDREIGDDDPDPWCDFELSYYPEDNKYQFEFETFLAFPNKDEGARDWIIYCLSTLTDYMDENELDMTKELNLYDVFTGGFNANTRFDSVEDAYAFLKMMVFGFHGKGME